MINLYRFILGPLDNNSYVIADSETHEAFVIDPSFDPKPIVNVVTATKLTVKAILLTHAHFDHIAGVGYLNAVLPQPLEIALSSADALLYNNQGNAALYGFRLGELPPVTLTLFHGQVLHLGKEKIEVRAVPGHTQGHVLFYAPSQSAAYCGDLIFEGGVGRTDLAGGDWQQLVESIRAQVFTLPYDTTLYPGHGPSTTVAKERDSNPYLE